MTLLPALGACGIAEIRRHLDALMLSLAVAQAGSTEAAREARKHAEAALGTLDRAEKMLSERVTGADGEQAEERSTCARCGASVSLPIEAGAARAVRARARPPVRAAEAAVATVPDPCDIDEPVNSL